jgi:hypothetical protein
VTLGCLVYLTLWWQTVIAGVGWSAPLWTASALAVAAAISLLLGHAVRVISSAVIVASAVDHSSGKLADRPVPAASWRTTIAAGALTFAGAALLLAWTPGSTRTAGTPPPALTVVPSGLRVRVIAIDGFDARVFEDLSSRGRVPALTAAFGGALARLDQGSAQAEDPARIWTTVATGQPPEVHGVQQLEMRRVAGTQGSVPAEERSPLARAIRGATDLVRLTRPAIASGSQRRAKTFWEVAAEAGLRTSVVNWWATWPARGDAGIVLSDRATLRLEHGGPLDAEIAPASLYEPLRQRWTGIKERTSAQVHELLQSPNDSSTAALLERSAELDAIQLALLAEVRSGNPDLAVVYLPGLDITQFALLGGSITSATGEHGLAASALSARLDALEAYYVVLDRLLAPLLMPAAEELVIVITEPGRVAADSGARVAARGAPGGAMAGAGGLGAKGMQTDIAPTILYALGVPIARDLPGAPMMGLFARAFVERYPVRFVATYGQPRPPAVQASGAPLDQEMIDRLRSLGYVR